MPLFHRLDKTSRQDKENSGVRPDASTSCPSAEQTNISTRAISCKRGLGGPRPADSHPRLVDSLNPEMTWRKRMLADADERHACGKDQRFPASLA